MPGTAVRPLTVTLPQHQPPSSRLQLQPGWLCCMHWHSCGSTASVHRGSGGHVSHCQGTDSSGVLGLPCVMESSHAALQQGNADAANKILEATQAEGGEATLQCPIALCAPSAASSSRCLLVGFCPVAEAPRHAPHDSRHDCELGLQEAQDGASAHMPHRPTKAMLAAAGLFESYERQILTVEGAIRVGPSDGGHGP